MLFLKYDLNLTCQTIRKTDNFLQKLLNRQDLFFLLFQNYIYLDQKKSCMNFLLKSFLFSQKVTNYSTYRKYNYELKSFVNNNIINYHCQLDLEKLLI